MKKKLNIPKDFWKDFKDRKDFDKFFSELFQEGINQMLKGKLTVPEYAAFPPVIVQNLKSYEPLICRILP